jgi:hypothetical protein
MTNTATERARASAWQSWETWCRLNGFEPFGVRTGLAEYLLWLVDPYGGALSAASAYQAYWAIRSSFLKAGWRNPARDPTVLAAHSSQPPLTMDQISRPHFRPQTAAYGMDSSDASDENVFDYWTLQTHETY